MFSESRNERRRRRDRRQLRRNRRWRRRNRRYRRERDPMLNSVLNGDWSNSVPGRKIPEGDGFVVNIPDELKGSIEKAVLPGRVSDPMLNPLTGYCHGLTTGKFLIYTNFANSILTGI